jgi:single-strand DNA-binding protein
VRFLESPNRDSGSGGGGEFGGSGGGYGSGSRNAGPRSGGSGNLDPFADDGKPIDISDDDLPF